MDEMTAQMSGVNLSALTGKPIAGDILLYALPVCGPYEALKVLTLLSPASKQLHLV